MTKLLFSIKKLNLWYYKSVVPISIYLEFQEPESISIGFCSACCSVSIKKLKSGYSDFKKPLIISNSIGTEINIKTTHQFLANH